MMKVLLLLLPALALHACSGSSDPADDSGYGVPPRVGQVAPDFTQSDPEGRPITLSSLRGNVVVLDFWASWCRPCLGSIDQFRTLRDYFAGKPVVILSVSLDFNLDNWRRMIADSAMTWRHVSDGGYWNNAVAKRYGITSIPHALLIDKQGVVQAIDQINYSEIERLVNE